MINSIETLAIQAESRGVEIFTIGVDDLPSSGVKIDKLRVQQILINLIHNAIKFSSRGDRIWIEVEKFLTEDIQNKIGVNIRVTDQGIGISGEDRKNLFKMFFKTNCIESRRINKGSHGVGLSICKKFARRLGGDLTLNESVVEGC